MAIDWDFIVGLIVLFAFILVIWARISKQTIGEVLADIRDMLSGGKEEIEERTGEIIEYE